MKKQIKENTKRIVALLVSVLILLTTLPFVFANAEEYTPVDFEGANLLDDGSFEEKTYRLGKAFKTDTTASNAHSGTQSVYSTGNGTERVFSSLQTTATLPESGKNYILNIWVRSSVAVSNAAFVEYTCSAESVRSEVVSLTGEWQEISVKITEIPENIQEFSIGIGITENVAAGTTVWFDDASLVQVSPLSNCGIIADGGFESLIYGNEFFINDTKASNAHTGIASLRAVANGTEQKYSGFKTVTVKGETTYVLGVWARSDKALSNKAFGFTGSYFDKSNQPTDLSFTEEFTVNKEWKFYSFEFKTPTGYKTLDINLGLYITAGVNEAGIWFDDFSLTEKVDYGLINNGGMEELDLGSKFYSRGTVVNNEAYSGEKSLYFGASASANSINISFPEVTDAEKTYRFSAYIKVNSVKNNNGSGADIYAKFALANGTNIKGDYYNNFRLFTGTTNGEWKYVTTTFTGAEVKFFDLYMYSDDIYIDEISLVEIEPIKLSDTGLIENGNFEGDVSSYSSGLWESDDTVYFADGHSLRVIGDASDKEKYYCKGFKNVDPNARYRFSVNIKTDSISTRDGVYLYINIIGPKTEQGTDKDYGWAQTASFSKKVISSGGTKDWAKYTFILDDLPEDVTGLYAYLRMDKGVTGTAWFDNLSAVKLETGDLTGEMTTFPEAGEIENYTNVYLEYGNYDVSYKYTLDGTDPKTSDTARLYNSNAGITITGKKTVKAYAVTGTMSESDVYTFDFTAPELVENGNFDSKIWDDKTGNWSYNSQGYAEVTGGHNENMIMTSKEFDLKAGLSYVLSLKAKGTDLNENTAGAYITIFDSKKGEEFGMIYNFDDKLITVDSGTTDWKTYTADIKDFEQNYDKAKVTLWYAPDKGSIAFDDIFIDVSQATEAAFSVTGYTNKLSNIYYGDPDKENIELFLLLENLTPIKVNNIKVDCLVYDIATGDIIAEQGFEYPEIEANGTLTQQISMVAATYYGAFLIKTHVYDGTTIDETADLRVARVPTVDRLNDYIGINTHISPLDKDYQKKTIDYVTAIGGKWIADEFTWETCEKVKGQVIMLKEYHDFVDYCEQVGAKIRLNVKITNPIYDGGHLVYTEEGINALINYVTTIAKTFKGRIQAYEIAGEYDEITSGSPAGTASPQIYAKILERCYKAIKAEDPDAMVIHGATLRRVDWLEQMFEAGGEPYTDALVIHPYTYWNNQSPYPTMGEWIEGFIDIAERWCPDKKIWITEYGWATAEYYANYGSIFETGYLEKTSAGNFMQMYLYSKKYPQIENIMMYDIYDDGTDITNREHNFGLLTNKKFGNLPKACYAVYPLMSNQLRDIVYEKNYDVNDEFAVFQYKLPDGKKVLAMWNLNTDDIDDRVFISTEGFSEDAYGMDSYSNEFSFDTTESENAIVLGRTPKFIIASELPEKVVIKTTTEEEDDSQSSSENDALVELPEFEEIFEYITSETPVFSDTEIEEETTQEEDETYYEKVIRRKRRRKNTGTPVWVWIIVAVGSIAVVGGGTTMVVFIKRKKRNK